MLVWPVFRAYDPSRSLAVHMLRRHRAEANALYYRNRNRARGDLGDDTRWSCGACCMRRGGARQ